MQFKHKLPGEPKGSPALSQPPTGSTIDQPQDKTKEEADTTEAKYPVCLATLWAFELLVDEVQHPRPDSRDQNNECPVVKPQLIQLIVDCANVAQDTGQYNAEGRSDAC